MSCNTKAKPISLIWSNNTLTSDGETMTYGVGISVGSPPQQLALAPVFILNNTYINNIATCGSNANLSCIDSLGGGFNPSQSSTFAGATINSWNGSQEDVADLLLNKGYVYFNDEVRVGSQSIPAVPLLLQNTGTISHGGLGLGKDSPFLTELKSAGVIPSLSFSLFTGLYSTAQAGMLMLGGYSERFYTGTVYGHAVGEYIDCTACVNVTGLVYQSGNTTVDLLAHRDRPSFLGIIEPFLPTIGLPDDIAYAFGNATKGTEVPGEGFWYFDKGNEPNASLLVTLQSGFTTTISHDALFTPPGYLNGYPMPQGTNSSRSRTYSLVEPWSAFTKYASNVDPNANAGWLGLPYTAFVYIMRDYERQTLQYAMANQNAVIQGDATAVCSVDSKDGKSGPRHVGAIVGGVIGGVVGLALIAFIVWFLLRRSKRSKTTFEPRDPNARHELSPTCAPIPKHEVPAIEKGELAVDRSTQIEELASDTSTQVEEMPAAEKRVTAELPA